MRSFRKIFFLTLLLWILWFFKDARGDQQERIEKEPEEPDYAFITGGPYTQGKNVGQAIWATRYGENDGREGDISIRSRDLISTLRLEWGLTDYLELDIIAGLEGLREEERGGFTTDEGDVVDTILGIRYRFLREDFAPITLTMGPQLLLPTGDEDEDIGLGEVGYAWDLALAKDWGGHFFMYASLNYSLTTNVEDPTPFSPKDFTVQNISWGTALSYRLLEQDVTGGAHHDIHLFAEMGGNMEDEIEEGVFKGRKKSSSPIIFSPGIRYGFLTARKELLEIGLSLPIGLNSDAEDWAVIFQIQFEYPF